VTTSAQWMQGAWRTNRDDASAGRILYRCTLRSTRSLVPQLADHPQSLCVREDSILPHLDSWIASLVSPEALAAGQDDPAQGGGAASLRAATSTLDGKIASLVAGRCRRKRIGDRRTERSAVQAQRRTGRSAGTVAGGEIRRAAHRDGDGEGPRRLGRHRRDPAEGTTGDEGAALRFVGSAARVRPRAEEGQGHRGSRVCPWTCPEGDLNPLSHNAMSRLLAQQGMGAPQAHWCGC
jgi:hypothetical protein